MKRRICAFLTALLLVLAACASSRGQSSSSQLQLYFVSTQTHGPALLGQPYTAATSPTPEELISALLSGPTQDDLRSPFPEGLALRSCKLEDGVLQVDFSEQYGGLANLALTLADYCLVLTVCQLEQVERVEITCAGRPLIQRSHQSLSQQDVLLALNHV